MKILLILWFVFSTPHFIDLEKRTLLDDKIEILVPKEFKEMSQELINMKYPGKNRPKLILTNEPGTINLGFSLLDSPADSTLIEAYKDGISDSYKKRFPSATWITDGVTTINGKKVGYFKIITDAIDQRIFNHLFLTDCKGKLMVGTFNCVEKDMKIWEPVSDQIVSSIKIR